VTGGTSISDSDGRRPRWPAVAALVVLAGLIVAGIVVLSRGRAGETTTAPGGLVVSTAPAGWVLPSLTGTDTIALTSFRGKPVVVNFFASWCTECRSELPVFATVSGELRGRVTFVGVNSLETGDGLAMARQFGIGWWPLAADTGGANSSGLHDALGGQGMPMTAFYDSTGKLLTVHLGAYNESELRAALRTQVGAGSPTP